MPYFDCYLVPVPEANLETYSRFSERISQVYREYGALRVVDCLLDPETLDGAQFHADGAQAGLQGITLPGFPAVAGSRKGEVVVLAWTEWPSKAIRDAALPRVLADPRIQPVEWEKTVFEGSRLIAGGFHVLLER